MRWEGDEICELLQQIKSDIEGSSTLSLDEKRKLLEAIDSLLELYGCNSEED
jgi:hypothetical protein